MPPIRVMPEIVSNKIAAGEVVERPASVVKELVENAIDAGSSRIQVEIEKGGRRLIRVSDNGCGMARHDALLSIERYATSKIREDKDLNAIATLGFRGEALPSIASVSRFTLVTRDSGSDIATQLILHGGRLKDVLSAGAPVGTMISVEDLFYNTPARRKFLKSIQTEMGHIADTLAEMALGWPQIRFRLSHDGRVIKDWAPGDERFRVADVLGGDLDRHLIAVAKSSDRATVSGWLAGPSQARTTSRGIHIFVNGRCVRDRVIRHALIEGYSGRQVKGLFPVAVLCISVAAADVDVNVHPTKHEIRFAHPQDIHRMVSQAVSKALSDAERPVWGPPAPPTPWGESVKERTDPGFPSHGSLPSMMEDRSSLSSDAPAQALPQAPQWRPSSSEEPFSSDFPPSFVDTHPPGNVRSAGVPFQEPLWQNSPLADLRILGQYRETYILCQSASQDLVLIDQHAAHERVAFERLKSIRSTQNPPSQRLVVPETLEFGFREADILLKMLPGLLTAGLEIEPFGGNTFVVKAVPDMLSNRPIGPLLRELVEKMADFGFTGSIEQAKDDILAAMACHSVVRANQTLTREQMRALLTQLIACEDPAHCPHGRPTWVNFSLREIEKKFCRTV